MSSLYRLEHLASGVSPVLGRRLELRRLEHAAAHRRSLEDVAFVGVTGSSGKTTTKELIAAVLSTRLRGTKSPDSLNRPRTVARTVLATASDDEFCVAEVSATFPGMVAEAAGVLRPRIAVVTAIGREHYKSFRTKEATAAEKGELVAALPPDGAAVLNADDPYVRGMEVLARGRVVTFGRSAGATLRAEDVQAAWPDRLTFTLRYEGRSFRVATRLVGKQWTSAVLAALAVGVALDVPVEAGIEAVAAFEPIAGRMSVVEDGGVTFIRDDWKAPLWAFDVILEFLAEARAPRKVFVVGSILDFSDSASRVYPRVAKRALAVADEVVFVGPEAPYALRGTRGDGTERLRAFRFVRDANEHLQPMLRDGDLVVLKGYNKGDHLLRLALARRESIRCWREACGRVIFCDVCRLRRVPGGPHLRRAAR